MIDLHTHTNESDGTLSPAELVDLASAIGLEALAITDHDTFAGYDQSLDRAAAKSLKLVCGIELSARSEPGRRIVHLLGYFLHAAPALEFRAWLEEVLASRRERNVKLVEKLKSMGVAIELADAERVGRTLTGRPHFARVLVQKGYARNSEEAFREYLGESAPGYVERDSPEAGDAIQRILRAGGLPVLAHPVRLGIRDPIVEEKFIAAMQAAGLGGLEVFHSDHSPADVARYATLAAKLGLAVTGGSDFHGDAKPHISLGTGREGNLQIQRSVLEELY